MHEQSGPISRLIGKIESGLDWLANRLEPRLPKKLTTYYYRHFSPRISRRFPSLVVTVTITLLLFIGLISTITLGHVLTVRTDDQLRASLLRAKISNLPGGQTIVLSADREISGVLTIPKVKEQATENDAFPDRKEQSHDRPPRPGSLEKAGSLAGMIHIIQEPNGSVLAGRLTPDYQVKALAQNQINTLLDTASVHPKTVYLPDLGRYRAIQLQTDKATITVALPLDSRDRVLFDFCLSILCYSLIGITLVWIWTRWRTRRALEPLLEVSQTARAVADYDLALSAQLPARVPDRITTLDTEAAEVGQALNVALDHIEQALKDREQTEASLQQFVADASHELRTPLATISGYAQLLKRTEVSDPSIQQAIERISSESKRMTDLVNHLLLLARLESGQTMAQAPVAIAELLVEGVSDAAIRSTGHQLDLELADDAIDLVTLGDSDKLRQVFTNLLSNACQHTPDGTQVTVSLQGEREKQQLLVQVKDNGPGIDKELLGTLFERFTRADSARSRSESCGLGLAIAHQIVSLHQGILAVESNENGTTFTVTLPLAS